MHHTAVLLRQDKRDQHRLVGYIVGESSLKGRLEQVRRYLATRLPHYMVPSVILCLDSMPLNATGKVNRSALPAPENTAGRAVSRVAQRNQVEESLAELWKSVLQISEAGIRDNFFEQEATRSWRPSSSPGYVSSSRLTSHSPRCLTDRRSPRWLKK